MKFVIFHGAFGNPSANWFPYLKGELFRLKQHVFIPAFPVEICFWEDEHMMQKILRDRPFDKMFKNIWMNNIL